MSSPRCYYCGHAPSSHLRDYGKCRRMSCDCPEWREPGDPPPEAVIPQNRHVGDLRASKLASSTK
jgi:hypothetical protein